MFRVRSSCFHQTVDLKFIFELLNIILSEIESASCYLLSICSQKQKLISMLAPITTEIKQQQDQQQQQQPPCEKDVQK